MIKSLGDGLNEEETEELQKLNILRSKAILLQEHDESHRLELALDEQALILEEFRKELEDLKR